MIIFIEKNNYNKTYQFCFFNIISILFFYIDDSINLYDNVS